MERNFSARCFVPWCDNSTTNNRQKVFVKVPTNLQQEWSRQVKLQYKASKSLYCCEDHLNLQEDLENYYQWKLKLRNPRLKPTAKLRISDEDIVITERDTSYKPKTPHRLPRTNFEDMVLVTDHPAPRPLAKWRQVCVMPKSGGDTQLLPESEPSWKPSDVISELQRVLQQTEIPEPMPKITAVRSLSQKDMKIDMQDATAPPSEAVAAEDSTPRLRPRRSCRKTRSLAVLDMIDDDDFIRDDLELRQNNDNDGCAPVADEDMVDVKEEIHDEISEIFVKEETEEAPDLDIDVYKALYIKNKHEISRLENENKRLRTENQKLNTKNQNLVDRIEKILKNINNDEAIDNNVNDNKNNQNIPDSVLIKKIDALIRENQNQTQHINILTEKNKSLLESNNHLFQIAKTQELTESNQTIEDKIRSLVKNKTYKKKKKDISVFVKQIKFLSEDVNRLKDENERLQTQVQELQCKETTEEVKDRPIEAGKRKRKELPVKETTEEVKDQPVKVGKRKKKV